MSSDRDALHAHLNAGGRPADLTSWLRDGDLDDDVRHTIEGDAWERGNFRRYHRQEIAEDYLRKGKLSGPVKPTDSSWLKRQLGLSTDDDFYVKPGERGCKQCGDTEYFLNPKGCCPDCQQWNDTPEDPWVEPVDDWTPVDSQDELGELDGSRGGTVEHVIQIAARLWNNIWSRFG